MAKKTKAEEVQATEERWERLHQDFLRAEIPVRPTPEDRLLRQMAKEMGLDLEEAKSRRYSGNWDLERAAIAARRWQRDVAEGASTEGEFVIQFATARAWRYGSTLDATTPEGAALLIATARNLWRRIMGPALRFEAEMAEVAAEKAYAKAREREERLREAFQAVKREAA